MVKRRITVKKIMVLIVAVVLLVGVFAQMRTIMRLKKEEKEQEVLLQEAKEYNERLKEEKQQSDSGQNYERLAREKLNMIKEGEKSVVNKKDDVDNTKIDNADDPTN